MNNKKKKPVNYVDNEKLYKCMLQYHNDKKEAQEKGLDKPRIPDYVGSCLLQIATNLSKRGNFISYSYREDMVSEGVANVLTYIDNFDPEKSKNPFSYFTTTIWYAFLRTIENEKKETYIRYKSYENAIVSGWLNDYQGSDDDHLGLVDMDSDYVSNVVEDFEKKLAEKKNKLKEAKKKKNEDSDGEKEA